VPKQFCSLNGGATLLEETLARADAFSAEHRKIVIVAAEHRAHWQELLADCDAENVIIQPRNRGTANGIVLGVTAIRERDPDALITILPSDHYVAHEDVLRRALSRALAIAETAAGIDAIYFLGVRPEQADPELGYIVRGQATPDGSCKIARFVEKPARETAERLINRRALWNSFILVARATNLVGLIADRYPSAVAGFEQVWRAPRRPGDLVPGLARLYALLPEIDFSRDVVEHATASLRVVPVPYCGWSDLGTPKRVAECLARIGPGSDVTPSRHFNLAEAHARYTVGSMGVALQSA
jgi:mannose-1-phosphate guanylyltransferase